jgi:hypothetical protein
VTNYIDPAAPTGPPFPPARAPDQAPPPVGTNTMALLALIFAFVFSPLGIIFGVIGRKQTRLTGQSGRGLATAGLVLGIVFTLFGVLVAIFTFVLAANITPSVGRAEVGRQITEQMTTGLGHRPESVTCAQDLPGKVGASINCTLVDAGQTYPVTARVTSMDGNVARFDVQVGTAGGS